MRKHDVVIEARKWLDVPWQHQGRTIHGIDCAGLIVKIAHDLKLSEFDTRDYGRRAIGHRFLKYFSDNMDEVAVTDLTPGNVMTFRDGIYPCHCGVIAEKNGQPSIIHAHATYGAVREEQFSQEWLDKRIRCFSYKGVEP